MVNKKIDENYLTYYQSQCQTRIHNIIENINKQVEPLHTEFLRLKAIKAEECAYQHESLQDIQLCLKSGMLIEEEHLKSANSIINQSHTLLVKCTSKAEYNYRKHTNNKNYESDMDRCEKDYAKGLSKLIELNKKDNKKMHKYN